MSKSFISPGFPSGFQFGKEPLLPKGIEEALILAGKDKGLSSKFDSGIGQIFGELVDIIGEPIAQTRIPQLIGNIFKSAVDTSTEAQKVNYPTSLPINNFYKEDDYELGVGMPGIDIGSYKDDDYELGLGMPGMDSSYKDDDYELGLGMADTIQKNLNLGMGDDETFGLTEVAKESIAPEDEGEPSDIIKTTTNKVDDKKEETKKQSLDDLVDSSAESFLKSLEGDDFKVRSLDEYKKDFADATGLDTSGKADKSTALMALGLALMQNKAGKGFNVSNMLSEVGKAGEAALPALEKAKTEAKQAQLAAGRYALQSRDRDTADKKSRLTELATYKRNRRDTLSDYYRQLGDQKSVEYIKHQYDKELKYIDYAQEKLTASAKGDEFKNIYQDKLLPGNEVAKVGYGFIGTEPKYTNPTVDATQVTKAYIKSQRALVSLDKLDELFDSLAAEPSQSGALLYDRAASILSSLGIGDADKWFGDRGISRESEAKKLINVLVQENKRFISQETGNGVSEGDKEDIKTVFGQLQVGKPIEENKAIIAEVRGLFDYPRGILENQVLSFLEDENKYVDNKTYQATVSEIEKLLGGAENVLNQTEFDVS
jgi:hypothetical protein